MGKGLKSLIIGGAIGAALGILYAPRAGKKTREILAKKTDAVFGQEAQDNGTILGEVAKTTKTAVEAGQDIFSVANHTKFSDIKKNAAEKGQKIFRDTTSFVDDFTSENVRPIFSEKNDELRKKINEAREKITAQVESNINNNTSKETIKAKQIVEDTSENLVDTNTQKED